MSAEAITTEMRKRKPSSILPLFTLQPGSKASECFGISSMEGHRRSGVSSICFVLGGKGPNDGHRTFQSRMPKVSDDREDDSDISFSSDENEEYSESDSENEYNFRCSRSSSHPCMHPQHLQPDLEQEMEQHATLSSLAIQKQGTLLLASCHVDGSAWLWDLTKRRIVSSLVDISSDPSPGLCLARVGNANNKFLFHTRQRYHGQRSGLVSLFDLRHNSLQSTNALRSVVDVPTYSSTFCRAAPCRGAPSSHEEHLVALPSNIETRAIVRDWRISPTDRPVVELYGASSSLPFDGNPHNDNFANEDQKNSSKDHAVNGMVTSLALCSSTSLTLLCGMESGNVYYHDLRFVPSVHSMKNTMQQQHNSSTLKLYQSTSTFIALGKDPILCVDAVPSSSHMEVTQKEYASKMKEELETSPTATSSSAILSVAGAAADADELMRLPPEERGTVTVMKTRITTTTTTKNTVSKQESNHDENNAITNIDNTTMSTKIRCRLSTCRLEDNDDSYISNTKFGISTCLFRADGRMFAVGGWDHRLRLYGRSIQKQQHDNQKSTVRLLASLHGHEGTVTAVDWAPPHGCEAKGKNSGLSQTPSYAQDGLLATGSNDGRICIWQVFPNTMLH